MAHPMYGQNKSDTALENAKLSPVTTAGADLAADTNSINLAMSTIYKGLATSADKPVVLPAIGPNDIGKKIIIISNATLANNGKYTITMQAGDTFNIGSTVTGLAVTNVAPAAGNNKLVCSGAATNSGLAKSSTMVFEAVSENEWLVVINSVATGTGNNFPVFSTV